MTTAEGKRLIGSRIERQNYFFMVADGALLACRIWPVLFLLFLAATTDGVWGGSVVVVDEPIAAEPAESKPKMTTGVVVATTADTPTAAGLLVGGIYTGPYFDTLTSNEIRVQVGLTAVLPCRVRQAGDRSVSWVRKGDGHLLSVGDDTFINDNRFQARRIEASETWTLQIRSVQMDDAGEYECQVSSNEPKISRIVILHPVEPSVTIKGAPDMYVKSGSPVTLHCQISSYLQAPSYVEWILNGTQLIRVKMVGTSSSTAKSYNQQQQQQRNGESNWVVAASSDSTGRSAVLERTGNDSLALTLTLPSVSPEDSGQYQCSPSNMAPARVSFHVVTGEHPAAMQHGDNGSSIHRAPSPSLCIASCLLLLLLSAIGNDGRSWRCYHILNRIVTAQPQKKM